jgi:ornithine cyclodeaminase/alanine dehydrogenase-like protein (mu-crystallin family)
MILFKSVGSALQDLALASRYYELLGSKPVPGPVDDVGSLRKPLWAN